MIKNLKTYKLTLNSINSNFKGTEIKIYRYIKKFFKNVSGEDFLYFITKTLMTSRARHPLLVLATRQPSVVAMGM